MKALYRQRYVTEGCGPLPMYGYIHAEERIVFITFTRQLLFIVNV